MNTARKPRTGRFVAVPRTSSVSFLTFPLYAAASCMLLVLCLTSCGKRPAAEPGATPESMVIEPGKSVGPIHAGMTVKDVIAKFGEPEFRSGNALEYKHEGLAVMPDAEGTVQVVMCGDVMGLGGPLVKNFRGRTKEGIGMLSTRDEVIKAYGPPTKAEGHPYGRESLEYAELGITFSIEAGKVHHMIVRLGEQFHPPPSVQIVQ